MKRTLGLLLLFVSVASAQVPDEAKIVAGADRAVERASKQSPAQAPGCVVGIALDGKAVYQKAFGMADLEHNVPLTPDSILESGSVAKQFTAASIVMLALDGKLGLDDPVRKYIPELPDYGAPLTIRHLLNHTSGIRDWGTVMALTGYGRGDRVISQDLAMDVITHQKGLDFKPGDEYSYSNSGYTLLSTIVERVSKQSLTNFTDEHFFKPLGMTHTSWRTDYQKIVPDRAQAYQGPLSGPFRLDMPFMNVYGNGGMLTTAGDWLKWNAALDTKTFGARFMDQMETTGVLNDGRKISYALGLVVAKPNGIRQVSHGGSTAGYNTFLSRYPDNKLSLAILCNSSSRDASAIERDIVREVLGPFASQPATEAKQLSPEELNKYVGLWRDEKTHLPVRTTVDKGTLQYAGAPIRPTGEGVFQGPGGATFTFKIGKDGKPESLGRIGGDLAARYVRDEEWNPTADDLRSLAGSWYSDESDATFTLVVDGGKAMLTQRPKKRIELRPLYKDHFLPSAWPGTVVWFTRDGGATVMHIGTARMRDMPFQRIK